jgi:hypothetical protein
VQKVQHPAGEAVDLPHDNSVERAFVIQDGPPAGPLLGTHLAGAHTIVDMLAHDGPVASLGKLLSCVQLALNADLALGTTDSN